MWAPFDTSCKDWETRLLAKQSLVPDALLAGLDQEMADKAERIFRRLKVTDQPGMPTMGEICRPWVFEFVRVIFGCINPETKARAIQNFMMLIPKKNGKSTIAAGIMMTALILNTRYQGQFLILAPTKDGADNAFDPAYGMVDNDPDLKKLFKANRITRVIEHRLLHSTLSVVAADPASVAGSKAIGVLVDELWELGKVAKAPNMLSEATGGLTSMAEGFVIYLTTQSDERPAGVFADKLLYHRKVRDGEIVDPGTFQIIYELPEHMLKSGAWKDLSNAHLVNPNWGASVRMEVLQQKLNEAMGGGNDKLRLFAAKHLNVEIGIGLRSDGWAGAEFWTKRAEPGITIESLMKRCEVMTFGLDGGGLDDLFGKSVIGREIGTKRWIAWLGGYVHPIVWERRPNIVPLLDAFVRDKELIKVAQDEFDEGIDDIDHIVKTVEMVADARLLGGVGVDPAGIGVLVDALAEIEITEENGALIGIPQGMGLMGAMKTTERMLMKGTMVHNKSAMADWCVGNIKIEQMATAIRATKANAGEKKIDPAIALFNSAYLMGRNPSPLSTRSVYRKGRGLLMV